MKHFLFNLYNTKRPASAFIRTFLLLVIFAVLPILSMSLFFSGIAERFWKSEGYRFNQAAFLQYTNQVDNKILSAQEIASQLADNPSVLSFITDPTFSEVQRNTLIMKSLNDIKTSDNGMDKIYLFSNFEKLVLTSDKMGFTYSQFFDKAALDAYSSGKWEPLTKRSYYPAEGKPVDFITIYQNVPKDSSGSLGCLILNMEKNFLFSSRDSSAMLQMSVYDESGSLLYTQNPDSNYQMSEDFKKQLYRSPGTFTYKDGKDDMVILNTFSPVTGWIYVGAAPMPVFFNSYRSISRLLSIIAVITLFFSFFLAILASYQVYKPLRLLTNFINGKGQKKEAAKLPEEYQYIQNAYKNIASQNENMEAILKSMRPAVKNDLFFSLLSGEIVSKDEILQKLDFIGENFTSRYYGCMVFQIADYENYIQGFDENSRLLHSYSLARLGEGIMIPLGYPFALIKVNRSTWAFIINISDENDRQESFVKIIHLFQEQLSLSSMPFLHMGYGRMYDNIFDLTYSYREALETLKFRLYAESPSSETLESIDSAMHIPDTKLKDSLMEAIRTGSPEEASQHCRAVFTDIELQNLTVEQAFSIASGITNAALELLISLEIDTSSYTSSDYYKKIDNAESISQLSVCTEEFVVSAAGNIQLFNRKHSSTIVKRLLEYINSHLGEDISLNDLADFSHLSAPYVSRLFKENLNVGFVEYMNTQRIAKARQLLKETTLTVEQIGFQVGFNNVRSFMRTFKKYENITPGQYRSQMKGG